MKLFILFASSRYPAATTLCAYRILKKGLLLSQSLKGDVCEDNVRIFRILLTLLKLPQVVSHYLVKPSECVLVVDNERL